MMKELIPIDTEYKGLYFRSRLEARWAVFFDAIKWKWEYEFQDYVLPSGRYLPDFYFPDINCYGEVKPFELTNIELKKCCELSEIINDNIHKIDVILFEGTPHYDKLRTVSGGVFGMDVTMMPVGDTYYPFYFSDQTKFVCSESHRAITKARQARFEFEWKEKYNNG